VLCAIFFIGLCIVSWRILVERFPLLRGWREWRIRRRDATTESPLEVRMAKAFDAMDWEYVREYTIGNLHVDFAFPQAKLAVECDGFRYHSSPSQRERDAKRDAFLVKKGWRVLRFSGARIHDDLDGCIIEVKDALRAK
jgi:very-short-patch-repair endonuclease